MFSVSMLQSSTEEFIVRSSISSRSNDGQTMVGKSEYHEEACREEWEELVTSYVILASL